MEPPRYSYTVAEMAEMWRLPPKSIRDRIRKGEIAAVNIGSKRKPNYRVTVASAKQFERENSTAA